MATDPSLVQSPTFLNAQLNFLDTRLALIHIPAEAVGLFIQPLIKLLVHNDHRDEDGSIAQPNKPWMFWHPFVHVSITPKCFVVCPRHEAERLFRPILHSLNPETAKSISISDDNYSAILISGEGLDPGQRVLDLTMPLAAASISIYFITSYYADFVLVPWNARPRVIRALEERGFIFAEDANGDAAQMINAASPLLSPSFREPAKSGYPFALPPASDHPQQTPSDKLQEQTLGMLRQHRISLTVDESIELVTCAGVKENTTSASGSNKAEGNLQLGIIKCLTSTAQPRFLAITLTDAESVSLTLETRLLSHFHNHGENLLLGKDGPEQTAVTLRDLPVESTGIVCGVATSLKEGMSSRGGDIFNLSYLSTTTAGHVLVYKDELKDALESLKGMEQNRNLVSSGSRDFDSIQPD